jgi:uncharacterized protein (DUF1499 family)
LGQIHATIINQQQHYIAATFTSKVFKFVDDFEIRIDAEEHQLHIRSASRIGYSDLGVNRRRVEQFRELFAAQQQAASLQPHE